MNTLAKLLALVATGRELYRKAKPVVGELALRYEIERLRQGIVAAQRRNVELEPAFAKLQANLRALEERSARDAERRKAREEADDDAG